MSEAYDNDHGYDYECSDDDYDDDDYPEFAIDAKGVQMHRIEEATVTVQRCVQASGQPSGLKMRVNLEEELLSGFEDTLFGEPINGTYDRYSFELDHFYQAAVLVVWPRGHGWTSAWQTGALTRCCLNWKSELGSRGLGPSLQMLSGSALGAFS